MNRGHLKRLRRAFVIAFASLLGCALLFSAHNPSNEPIVGAWESVISPKSEFRFFPDSRMEVYNLFRATHEVGHWERLEGELYRDPEGTIWGPFAAENPKHFELIESYDLESTGGVAYSYRTIRYGKKVWFATEVRIIGDEAYFSDYDAWMKLERGKTNSFVQSMVNLGHSLGNVFGISS